MPEWKGRVPLTRSHCERITWGRPRRKRPRPSTARLELRQTFNFFANLTRERRHVGRRHVLSNACRSGDATVISHFRGTNEQKNRQRERSPLSMGARRRIGARKRRRPRNRSTPPPEQLMRSRCRRRCPPASSSELAAADATRPTPVGQKRLASRRTVRRKMLSSKQACDSQENRLSPPTMDTRHFREVTSTLSNVILFGKKSREIDALSLEKDMDSESNKNVLSFLNEIGIVLEAYPPT
ncbi:hypothetical protein EVAR_52896_1 [Eumeta japonica]|uniref:Uncharacterized protein n=1 Tax=Eumeta variegata TaxID=151549 RepID=A0A4C1Z1H6_EUMVA|nr:hypothetical protein EVAR_52896_1 [Eumeta japonica]